eukprot:SAG11_NODE_11168_length_779_cov_1.919118_1_plen_142_part_10
MGVMPSAEVGTKLRRDLCGNADQIAHPRNIDCHDTIDQSINRAHLHARSSSTPRVGFGSAPILLARHAMVMKESKRRCAVIYITAGHKSFVRSAAARYRESFMNELYLLVPGSYCGNATTRFDTDEVIRFTSIPSQILDVLG